MFRHIIVGADGSPEGQDAVVLGASIAAATGSGLAIVQSFDPSLASDGNLDYQAQINETEHRLRVDSYRWAPRAYIEISADPLPARALRAYAERWQADLVVIGSSRRAPTGRCTVGRTGRRLLDKMPVALAVASRGLSEKEPLLSTIAVGYDGGPESARALQLADELAAAADAELLIETIYERPTPAFVRGEQSTPRLAQELRETERRGALAVAQRAVARTSPRSRLGICVGEPGLELRKVSESVDLTVIGSRRWGPSARIVLGEVGETLVSDCGSSLLITRRGSRRPSRREPLINRVAQTEVIVPRM